MPASGSVPSSGAGIESRVVSRGDPFTPSTQRTGKYLPLKALSSQHFQCVLAASVFWVKQASFLLFEEMDPKSLGVAATLEQRWDAGHISCPPWQASVSPL